MATIAVRAAFVTLLMASTFVHAASIVEVTNFGSNPGNLRMFKYVPDNMPGQAPMVVALHGAASSHLQMADDVGWRELADRYKFALLLPAATWANNFKTFRANDPAHNRRGYGEALSIKQMVDWMLASSLNLDATRVHVTGFSAGAYMTTVMLAAYPEVFAAGHPFAGGAYPCETSNNFQCGSLVSKSPQQWGDLVRAQYPGYVGPWPRVLIAQGGADNFVDTGWIQEIVDQWTNVHGIDQTADVTDTVKGYPRAIYKDGSGNAKVATITVTGLSHQEAVDPGSNFDQCGREALIPALGPALDVNMCSAYEAAVWFGIAGTPGSANPPPGSTPPSGTQADFGSINSEDGYMLAFSDGSFSEIGSYESSGGMGMGRTGLWPYKWMRTVLSFDTSSLPNDATITRAWLTITKQQQGGNPWTDPAGNQLQVNISTACLSGSCAVQAADWSAVTTVHPAATIPEFSGSTQNSTDFDYIGRAMINRSGRTQVLLKFKDFQGLTQYLTIYGGGSANRAVLHVLYE